MNKGEHKLKCVKCVETFILVCSIINRISLLCQECNWVIEYGNDISNQSNENDNITVDLPITN